MEGEGRLNANRRAGGGLGGGERGEGEAREGVGVAGVVGGMQVVGRGAAALWGVGGLLALGSFQVRVPFLHLRKSPALE